jgi:CRISPR system Cascade subunit CasB
VGADNRPSVERRFVGLLNCHADDLDKHLRQAVGLLKSKDIPIDWTRLLHDIQGWIWESRNVQLAWARAFWGQATSTSPGQALSANAGPAATPEGVQDEASPSSDEE